MVRWEAASSAIAIAVVKVAITALNSRHCHSHKDCIQLRLSADIVLNIGSHSHKDCIQLRLSADIVLNI
jgi:hypothetical protein